jgi:hypothetical protein
MISTLQWLMYRERGLVWQMDELLCVALTAAAGNGDGAGRATLTPPSKGHATFPNDSRPQDDGILPSGWPPGVTRKRRPTIRESKAAQAASSSATGTTVSSDRFAAVRPTASEWLAREICDVEMSGDRDVRTPAGQSQEMVGPGRV